MEPCVWCTAKQLSFQLALPHELLFQSQAKKGKKILVLKERHHQKLLLDCQRGAVSSKAKDSKKQTPVNLSVYGKF